MIVRNSGPHIEKQLRERIEELEAELAELKASLCELAGREDWHRQGMTPQEVTVFSVLQKRKISTTRQLLFALYPNDPDRRAEADLNIVRVLVSNIRRKTGIKVKCQRNVGWWIEQRGVESRAMNG